MGTDRRETTTVKRIIDNQESFIVRLYARIRFQILRQTFLQEIGQYLPREGRVLDLGCGFGLFSLYFAIDAPGREMSGVDRNPDRIKLAETCAARLGVTNVDYIASDVLAWEGDSNFDAIYMLDLVHHLPRDQVSSFLEQVRSMLQDGGMLILKEVSNKPYYKRMFTYALDRLMVGMEPIHYWDPDELTALLDRLGLDVKRHTMNDYLPYPHILYICTRRDD